MVWYGMVWYRIAEQRRWLSNDHGASELEDPKAAMIGASLRLGSQKDGLSSSLIY
jgi:hypothetical protein